MSIVSDRIPASQDPRPRVQRAEELALHLAVLLTDRPTCIQVLAFRTDHEDFTRIERFAAQCYAEMAPDAEDTEETR